MRAVTRLLSGTVEMHGPEVVRQRLVSEAREFFGVVRTVLLTVAGREGRVEAVASCPPVGIPTSAFAVADLPPLDRVVTGRSRALRAEGEQAQAIDRALGTDGMLGSALLLPMRAGDSVGDILLLLDDDGRHFSDAEVEMAGSFAAAAAASLAQLRLAEEHAAQIAQQAALARAAKTLNELLDIHRVLVRICHEAASILDGDNAVIYRGDASRLTVEAVYAVPPEAIGYRLPPGAGLISEVARDDRPMITNDYQGLAIKADPALFGDMQSCLAVPLHWDGSLRGVLAVGYNRPHLLTNEDLSLLEAFGELAAAASRNASVHAGLAEAASTDGLTGCLNHSAMQHALRGEIERCERTGQRLSLVLIDMDSFKQVNEEHGHLAGDEVLRRVGEALRASVRPYDIVARYGGDEFAIVAVEADEGEAVELATRAIAGVEQALRDAPGACQASAGVAEWQPQESPTSLIGRADRALLYGKQRKGSGVVVEFSGLSIGEAESELPVARLSSAHQLPASLPAWPERSREQHDRLRARTRQLALANALGAKLAAMTDPQEIIETAVEELHEAFGYYLCSIVRLRPDNYVEAAAQRGEAASGGVSWNVQPRIAGVIGRCLRERFPVIVDDVQVEPDYIARPDGEGVRSELAVPLWVGEDLWGAIDLEERRPGAFDEDDARLVRTVADQVGSALRSAMLYERLDRAYLGTAEALSAALEVRGGERIHSRSFVDRSVAVGRALGMGSEELRTLRFAAIFGDIGTIAVPDAVLNKRGPLTDAERREIERHTIVSERILSSVEFLADVLPLVRHAHEHWDGSGYPDGIDGEAIPLGSRIILACDAFDAMISGRPYREPMSISEARDELVAGAGAQFDARVVDALLAVIEADEELAEELTPRSG